MTFPGTLTTPSVSDLLNAANDAPYAFLYGQAPVGYSLLTDENGPIYVSNALTSGLVAAAYINNVTNQIIIAFRGVSTPNPQNYGSTVDDFIIWSQSDNSNIKNSVDAFVARVIAAATSRGIGSDNVFVTGNSLGGYEAELAARDFTLSGATFGAPGINGQANAPNNNDLENFIMYGDPVGNYGSDTGIGHGAMDPSGHYGYITNIGSYQNQLRLAQDAAATHPLFGSATADLASDQFDISFIAGLADEAVLILTTHPITSYATALGVTLQPTPTLAPGTLTPILDDQGQPFIFTIGANDPVVGLGSTAIVESTTSGISTYTDIGVSGTYIDPPNSEEFLWSNSNLNDSGIVYAISNNDTSEYAGLFEVNSPTAGIGPQYFPSMSGFSTLIAGAGTDVLYAPTGDNLFYGNTDVTTAATDIMVAAPYSTTAADTDNTNIFYTGYGNNIIVGGVGSNIFNINQFGSNSSLNFIWGGGGTSDYNFIGAAVDSGVDILYMNNPTASTIANINIANIESLVG